MKITKEMMKKAWIDFKTAANNDGYNTEIPGEFAFFSTKTGNSIFFKGLDDDGKIVYETNIVRRR